MVRSGVPLPGRSGRGSVPETERTPAASPPVAVSSASRCMHSKSVIAPRWGLEEPWADHNPAPWAGLRKPRPSARKAGDSFAIGSSSAGSRFRCEIALRPEGAALPSEKPRASPWVRGGRSIPGGLKGRASLFIKEKERSPPPRLLRESRRSFRQHMQELVWQVSQLKQESQLKVGVEHSAPEQPIDHPPRTPAKLRSSSMRRVSLFRLSLPFSALFIAHLLDLIYVAPYASTVFRWPSRNPKSPAAPLLEFPASGRPVISVRLQKLLRVAGIDDHSPCVGLLTASVIAGSWRVVRPAQGTLELLVGENSSLSADLAFHLRSFPVKLARKRAGGREEQFRGLTEGTANPLKSHGIAEEGARRGSASGLLEDGGRSKSGTPYRQSPFSSNAAQKNGCDDPPFCRI